MIGVLGRLLLSNPVLMREMEIRAARDEGYRLFNYNGPGLYFLLLESPAMFGLIMGDLLRGLWTGPGTGSLGAGLMWAPALFLVTAWLQVLYFAHSASRFCAGCVAIERERGTLEPLRLLPGAARRLFVGKYLAAVAPLLIEAVLSIPLLSLYTMVGSVRLWSVLTVGALNIAIVLMCGLWGMYWSICSQDVMAALSRASVTVLSLNVAPLVAACLVLFIRSGYLDSTPRELVCAVFSASPLYMVGGLTMPIQGAALWSLNPLAVTAVWLAVAVSGVLLYRAGLRRLAGY